MHSELPIRDQATDLLTTAESGEVDSLDRLVPIIYEELRAIAHRQLRGEQRNPSIQTTELVHEIYLKLVDDARVTQRGRAYFYGTAARAMRQVLVDAARKRNSVKRGGGISVVTLDDDATAVTAYADELLDLDDALSELAKHNPRQANVVECRYFGGLGVEETAAALDISPRTVKSDWALAKAWLFDELRSH
ncbi:MAG TPA: ECF-type sigma factor [Gemmatimonadaceae bacterium]|nr:ECF-type sigma factor [Gemmatimonadaceae bacterium]